MLRCQNGLMARTGKPGVEGSAHSRNSISVSPVDGTVCQLTVGGREVDRVARPVSDTRDGEARSVAGYRTVNPGTRVRFPASPQDAHVAQRQSTRLVSGWSRV